MPAQLIRAIFFDAVGTLIHPDPPAPVVYEQVGKRFGSRLGASEIKRRFAEAFDAEEQSDRRGGWQTSENREIERWRSIVAHVLDDSSDPLNCFQLLFNHFSKPEAWRCDPATSTLFNDLEGQGFFLGMASNYDSRLRAVVSGKPELAAIRHLCISSEIGWRKPAREFFAAVCDSIELSPEQILIVGDDPVNDFEGAVAAGLPAVLFDQLSRHSESPRTGMIRQLNDLLPLVKELKH